MDSVVQSIVDLLGGKVPGEIIVFLVSMMPLLELRGSLLAAGFINIEFLPAYVFAVLGNMLPIPFILIFITKTFEYMKKVRHLDKIAIKLEEKALSKREQIDKYGYFGLFLFVAIPLPGTGAWTGALLATLLKMKLTKAFVAIFLGVMAAGLVVSLISFGLIKNIF